MIETGFGSRKIPAHAAQKGCPACQKTDCNYCDLMERPSAQLEDYAATIRNQTIDAILTCAETEGEWFRIDGTDYLYLNYSVLSNKCESLRTPSPQAQQNERGDQR